MLGFFFFCFSWISCIPTGTVQAQEKTGMKPPPTISLTPASNLWVIQMWVEALDESFLRGCTGKLCTTINVASPGTQMVELKGKPSKYNKTLLLHVTWCTLHSYTKCHVMKCRFFFRLQKLPCGYSWCLKCGARHRAWLRLSTHYLLRTSNAAL